jgi:hypothetical protein
MSRLKFMVLLASVVTVLVALGAHWWLLIPAWSLVIVVALEARR